MTNWYVQFRSADDATAAMAFDGVIFVNGPLKIRRPKDYGGEAMMGSPGIHVPGAVSTNVPDSINKVFVGGLPAYLNEEQVMELLKSFGELRAFNLVRENGNGASKVCILIIGTDYILILAPSGLCFLRICRPSRYRCCHPES
jgi:splicing factor U2AF 65 kDa subunit